MLPHFWGLLNGSKRQSLHNLTREEQVMTPSTWVKGCLTMFGILKFGGFALRQRHVDTISRHFFKVSFIMQISKSLP